MALFKSSLYTSLRIVSVRSTIQMDINRYLVEVKEATDKELAAKSATRGDQPYETI